MPPLRPALLLLLGTCGVAGCLAAGQQAAPCATTASRLAGAWDAVLTRQRGGESGRIDRHELQIFARGTQLVGFWDHAVSWQSPDSRSFVCGRKRQLEVHRRLHFAGTAYPGFAAVELQAGPWLGPPCAPELAELTQHCRLLVPADRQLALRCGARVLRLQPRLSRRIPLELSWQLPGKINGVWTWTHRSEDDDGDLKLEEETWHLHQQGNQIRGHYDRRVRVRSGDGRRFQCNGLLRYESSARFWVGGSAAGRSIRLRELRYTTAPSPCEQGQRSLDSYSGVLSRDDLKLELSWGKGNQILSRRY